MDLTQTSNEKRIFEDDQGAVDEVLTKDVFDIKSRNKTTKKKKVSNKIESKRRPDKKERTASLSNNDICVDECRVLSAQHRVAECRPETVRIDIQLPARTGYHLQKPERDGCRLSGKLEGCGRSKENKEVQEALKNLNVHLVIRCDAAAAATDDDDDAMELEVGTSSDVARSVNHAGTDHFTLRPAVSFIDTEPCNDYAQNTKRTSNVDHSPDECHPALPTVSQRYNSDPPQETHDTARKPLDKELHRTFRHHQTSPSSPCSVSLVDIRRVLRELNIMLDEYKDTNLQSEPCDSEARENAGEERIEQLIPSDGNGKTTEASNVLNVKHIENNGSDCYSKEPELRVYRATANVVNKRPKRQASPTTTDQSTVPTDVSDLLEVVNRLTLKTSKAEERMNRLECDLDVLMTPRTGNYQHWNEADQERIGIPVENPNTRSLRSNQERIGPRRTDNQDNRTSDAGKLNETA